MERSTVFLLVFVSGCQALISHTPEYIRPCPRSDPNGGDCLKALFQHIFPYLAVGIPELGVAPYEPLHVERISLSKGQGAVTVAGSFRQVVVHGLSNASMTSAKMDEAQRRLDFGVKMPELQMEGDYDLKGHVLLLPIVGNGRASLKLKNVSTTVSTRFALEQEVLKVVVMKVDFDVGSMNVHLHNLFNGNKVLGHTLNAFLNKNAQEVLADLKEPLGESLSQLFVTLINQIFLNVPLAVWLPRR